MIGVKQATRLTILVMVTLWFTLSSATVWASSTQATHGEDQAATHVVAADSHGEAAAAHGEVGGSLSSAKLMDLFWRVLNFAVLVIGLVYFCAKPIGSGLAGRQKQIKDEIEDLEARKAAAEKSYQEFEAKLATVEKDIDKVVDKAIAQAQVEKAKIIEKAEQAAEDIKRQAERTIHKEIMEAKRYLKNDVADQAAVMAEELIVKNLTDADQVKIVEDYLAKVGAVQ
ncbi:ATP synthase F0 subunit B [Desulfosediminicola flagellatus]|uniref:F0F1 ATP synthase subunit B family protein n=1 Tax=Desulfosediminicola flagellatus TaxID=2569541 RepID=UPI0010AD2C9C|nr:ATP synthase F0 subunit B [Desulfosediminicola flagellatus]